MTASTQKPSFEWPVFVFPETLNFEEQNPKLVVTLYNTYDFPVVFTVSCSAARKYAVVDVKGNIRPRSCVDIVVRHKEVCKQNLGKRDKFRIDLFQQYENGMQKIGSRDIISQLVASAPEPEQPVAQLPATLQIPQRQTSLSPTRTSHDLPNLLVLLIGMVCVIVVCWPEDNNSVGRFLTITTSHKLVASYILGLVTFIVFR